MNQRGVPCVHQYYFSQGGKEVSKVAAHCQTAMSTPKLRKQVWNIAVVLVLMGR